MFYIHSKDVGTSMNMHNFNIIIFRVVMKMCLTTTIWERYYVVELLVETKQQGSYEQCWHGKLCRSRREGKLYYNHLFFLRQEIIRVLEENENSEWLENESIIKKKSKREIFFLKSALKIWKRRILKKV